MRSHPMRLWKLGLAVAVVAALVTTVLPAHALGPLPVTTPPQVTILSPAAGAATNASRLDVVVRFQAGVPGVKFLVLTLDQQVVDTAIYLQTVQTATRRFQVDLSGSGEGRHALEAFLFQGSTQIPPVARSGAVRLLVDRTPPALVISAPSAGAVVSDLTLTVAGTAEDALSGIASIDCGTVAAGRFQCTRTLVEGANTISVRAVDRAGNVARAAVAVTFAPVPQPAPFDPITLPQVALHPGLPFYWERPYFANAMAAGEWVDQSFTPVAYWQDPQFDANGYPQFLHAGQTLRGIVNGLNSGYLNVPSTWPDAAAIFRGHLVLTWQGNADLQLQGPCEYLDAESSGPRTGLLVNGRRVYRCPVATGLFDVTAIASPITDIKLWLPDPSDPQNRSLDNQLFHPAFLARANQAAWGLIRFMDWGATNASPVQDWDDRRLPTHAFGVGVLNTRAPAAGFGGDRLTGVPYEHMVALANATQKDLWINVPHLATDDFVTKLAQLIRYGSDGTDPYTSPQAHPVWAPLDGNRRVFVEYSNEIWSSGDAFAQGEWAQQQAAALGISKAQFNARRFSEVWRGFQQVFEGTSRLVRVAAVFTALQSYTEPFLTEIRDYGATLSPAVEPDVIAGTTYFGNGIQDWVHARSEAQAATSDPWFYTGDYFDPGFGLPRPVSLPPSHPYWTSADFARHMDEAFAEFRQRMLAGNAAEGGGPDATGTGGGFDTWLRQLAQTVFAAPKPLVAYEGGPSLYTDYLDGGDPRDDGITLFVSAMNRHPAMRQLYSIHLNMAKSKGLRTHVPYTDAGLASKFGQFGHLEHWLQAPGEAPKWDFIVDWVAEMAGIRHVDDAAGNVPSFVDPPTLPHGVFDQSYLVDLATTGGDGARTATVIGQNLAVGLTAAPAPGAPGTVRIAGTPGASGMNYVFARVTDADGDPAWRVFSFYVAGGPGTLVEPDLAGTDPGLHAPWMPTFFVHASVGAYSGLELGPGAVAKAGNNALAFSISSVTLSTLADAVRDGEYVGLTLQAASGSVLNLREGELRFTINRESFHAPRSYAIFTSVGGFVVGQEIFVTPRIGETGEPREFSFLLPDNPAYDGLAGPVEIRLYGFDGQFDDHRTRLTAIKLSERVP